MLLFNHVVYKVLLVVKINDICWVVVLKCFPLIPVSCLLLIFFLSDWVGAHELNRIKITETFTDFMLMVSS